jgi:hypothetical protein
MEVGSVPAGWYADNQDAALLRWWDGAQWTAHARPRAGSVPVAPTPQPAGPAGAVAVAAVSQPASGRHEWHSGSKHDLQAEVDRLRHALDGLGVTEREQLAAEVTRLRDDVARLRRDEAGLSAAVGPLRAELAALGSQRAQLAPLQAEVQQL